MQFRNIAYNKRRKYVSKWNNNINIHGIVVCFKDTMTELLENGVNNMNNNIKSMTIEEIEELGQATMDACSNIEQVTDIIKL